MYTASENMPAPAWVSPHRPATTDGGMMGHVYGARLVAVLVVR